MNLSTEKKQIQEHGDRLLVAKGRERDSDGMGVWGWQMQTIAFGVDEQ